MTTRDPALAKLLRWYPRAWRERYGAEFLALVEDTLDGRPPGWRLRLGVVRAGLRERGHQARRAAARRLRTRRGRAFTRWLSVLPACAVLAVLPQEFRTSPSGARAGQAAAALDVLAGIVVFAGAAALAGGLMALPAFVRYLRAGGWPKIRHRVARAARATVLAGGALAGLVIAAGSMTPARLSSSWLYALGVFVTAPLLAVALGRWISLIAATSRHLDLAPGLRAAELVLAAVTGTVTSVMVAVNLLWLSVIESSVAWLLAGMALFVAQGTIAPDRMRRAVRSARRPRPGGHGGTRLGPLGSLLCRNTGAWPAADNLRCFLRPHDD